jgi:hypothetical protein
MQAIAFALWQLKHAQNLDEHTSLTDPEASQFVLGFACPWDTIMQAYCIKSQTSIFVRFQLRWMDITSRCQTGAEDYHGVWLHRDEGDIPNGIDNADNDLQLFEMRHAFALYSTVFSRLPLYIIVILYNDSRSEEQVSQTSVDIHRTNTENVIPMTYHIGCLTGIGVFLSEVSRSLKQVSLD